MPSEKKVSARNVEREQRHPGRYVDNRAVAQAAPFLRKPARGGQHRFGEIGDGPPRESQRLFRFVTTP
jgi:hypothetical protein